jgi:hypothetical protein
MSRDSIGGQWTTRIPADVDREDRVLASLTARQVAILGGTAVVLWAAFMATRHLVPPLVFIACVVPVASVAVAFALVRRDGLSLDRLALAAVRQRLAPRQYVSGEVAATPSYLALLAANPPASLPLPVSGIRADGLIELADHGCAALVSCSTVSFALATVGEQEAMVAGFARCLHGLSSPVQILVRAERMNLTPMAARVLDSAPALPDPQLEAAAREHAEFLAELAVRSELLWRQVLLVVRDADATTDTDASPVLRQAENVAAALTATGIDSRVLDGSTAAVVLAAACDPNNPAPCSIKSAEEVTTGR